MTTCDLINAYASAVAGRVPYAGVAPMTWRKIHGNP